MTLRRALQRQWATDTNHLSGRSTAVRRPLALPEPLSPAITKPLSRGSFTVLWRMMFGRPVGNIASMAVKVHISSPGRFLASHGTTWSNVSPLTATVLGSPA
jgi:hypothetical protein